jgi:hypothetical protein
MSSTVERFSWLMALLTMMWAGPAWAFAGQDVTRAAGTSDHPDPSIRLALSLIGTPAPVPIEVVDVDALPKPLRQLVKRACAYVQRGVPRIFVISSCRAYRDAGVSLFEAMKLAAMLRHEIAHLDGADEGRASLLEALTFRELLRRAPAHLQTPGITYAVQLERRAAALQARTERHARVPTERMSPSFE